MPNWNQYQAPNFGHLYYRHVYQEPSIMAALDLAEVGVDSAEIRFRKLRNNEQSPFNQFYNALFNYRANDFQQITLPEGVFNHSFPLKVIYPGLFTGSGYAKSTGGEGDFKFGYFFDHTSGQPVIPGSSIKGLLRSVFECDVDAHKKDYTGEDSLKFVQFILNEMNPGSNDSLTVEIIKNLKEQIFGEEKELNSDVFFDAVIHIQKTGRHQLLDKDFITVHEDPLQEPIPNQFLKVSPGVVFEFRFKLTDSSPVAEGWDAPFKEKFFKQVLLTMGAGAKTTVGYGRWSTDLTNKPAELNEQVREEGVPQNPQRPALVDTIPQETRAFLKKGKTFIGIIVGIDERNMTVQFSVEVNSSTGTIKEVVVVRGKDKLKGIEAAIGMKVRIEIKNEGIGAASPQLGFSVLS